MKSIRDQIIDMLDSIDDEIILSKIFSIIQYFFLRKK